MSRTVARLDRICGSIRRVEPTVANVNRLLSLYEQACLTDAQLAEAALRDANRRASVDGMTERHDFDSFRMLLQWPWTMALEIPNKSEPLGQPSAFVLNHFADSSDSAIDAFRSLMLGNVFNKDLLQFDHAADERAMDEAFDHGLLLYFGEFVSLKRPVNSLALVVESYRRVVRERLGVRTAGVVGKCLEQVRIGNSVNANGNTRIKRIANSIGLKRIAVQVDSRSLTISPAESSGCRNSFSTEEVSAQLTFGFYLGDTNRLCHRFIDRSDR